MIRRSEAAHHVADLGEVTGARVGGTLADLEQGLVLGADRLGLPAAGAEAAARGRVGRGGHVALEHDPLASAADRATEIAWGLRDFEVRFGRRPTGMWLPETAVDRATSTHWMKRQSCWLKQSSRSSWPVAA